MRGEHAETAGCAVARSRAAAPSRVRAPRVRELLELGVLVLAPAGAPDADER